MSATTEISNENASDKDAIDQEVEQQEKNLLEQFQEYKTKVEENSKRINILQNLLKAVTEERDNYKNQVERLERDLADAIKAQAIPEAQEILSMKTQSEDMLTRAKGMLFEKTKIIKNQELQIEALLQQVSSLKEVVGITKDLLDIRNMETKHLQERLETMESKIATEKERQELVQSKLERMVQMNTDLKREYETQLSLFNALRKTYNERDLARGVLNDLRSDVRAARGANAERTGTVAPAAAEVAAAQTSGAAGTVAEPQTNGAVADTAETNGSSAPTSDTSPP